MNYRDGSVLCKCICIFCFLALSNNIYAQEPLKQELSTPNNINSSNLHRHIDDEPVESQLEKLQSALELYAVSAPDKLLQQIFSAMETLPLGKRLEGGADIAHYATMLSGWTNIEPWGIWSIGKTSETLIRLPDNLAKSGFMLRITGRYFNNNALTELRINDNEIVNMSLENAQIKIPASMLAESTMMKITLTHESPTSPASVSKSDDPRAIAFGLTSLELGTLSP